MRWSRINEKFLYAVSQGDLAYTQKFLREGADFNYKDGEAVRIAVTNCHLDIIHYFLKSHIDINWRCGKMLHYICASHVEHRKNTNIKQEVFDFLLCGGVIVDDDSLIISAKSNNLQFIKLLIEFGANPLSKQQSLLQNILSKPKTTRTTRYAGGPIEPYNYWIGEDFGSKIKISKAYSNPKSFDDKYRNELIQYLISECGCDPSIIRNSKLANEPIKHWAGLQRLGIRLNERLEVNNTPKPVRGKI